MSTFYERLKEEINNLRDELEKDSIEFRNEPRNQPNYSVLNDPNINKNYSDNITIKNQNN